MAPDVRAWLQEIPAAELSSFMIGRITIGELPFDIQGMMGSFLGHDGFVLPQLPNYLFTRDSSAWIYGGVVLSHMHWTARKLETL
jgi:arginine deiminase